MRRAAQEWENDPDHARTALAFYYALFAAEKKLEAMFNGREQESRVAARADREVLRIRNEALRQKTVARAARRIDYWWIGRFRESCNFLDVHERDIKVRAAERRWANPGETESQSWFWAKQEAVEAHIDSLHVLENRTRRDISRIIEAAIARDFGQERENEERERSIAAMAPPASIPF